MKANCWEFMKCGREPGGYDAQKLGVCPVTIDDALDGVHGGSNAGRACWVMAGTLGTEEATCKFATSMANCLNCAFFKSVKQDEGKSLKRSMMLLETLEHKHIRDKERVEENLRGDKSAEL